MRYWSAVATALALSLLASGCARYDYTGSLNIPPAVGVLTRPGEALAQLPPPARPVSVAVYDYQDLTGQNKSSFNSGFAEFSRAITQGTSTILVDALKTAGQGTWFKVSERGYLDSLLRERRLIQETYTVLKRNPRNLIEPLNFAEYLITGGVVSYDSPIQNASVAGGYAGYTGGLSGRKDLVTVNVRLVRVRDGLVISSINASRPIVMLGASANVARILGTSIVEAQASAGLAEATQIAVRESIETAVYELIRQNVSEGRWSIGSSPQVAEARPLAVTISRGAALSPEPTVTLPPVTAAASPEPPDSPTPADSTTRANVPVANAVRPRRKPKPTSEAAVRATKLPPSRPDPATASSGRVVSASPAPERRTAQLAPPLPARLEPVPAVPVRIEPPAPPARSETAQ